MLKLHWFREYSLDCFLFASLFHFSEHSIDEFAPLCKTWGTIIHSFPPYLFYYTSSELSMSMMKNYYMLYHEILISQFVGWGEGACMHHTNSWCWSLWLTVFIHSALFLFYPLTIFSPVVLMLPCLCFFFYTSLLGVIQYIGIWLHHNTRLSIQSSIHPLNIFGFDSFKTLVYVSVKNVICNWLNKCLSNHYKELK